MQQTAAESTLFAQKAGLAFHAWLFLGGDYTQECVRWLVQGMIHGVIIKLVHMCDVMWKMVNVIPNYPPGVGKVIPCNVIDNMYE